MKIAVFPGSFDPITLGHEDIVRRALPLFDKIIVAIGTNADKKCFFTLDERVSFLKKVFEETDKIEIDTFSGLTVDYCRKKNAGYVLRGLRTAADFEYENAIAHANRHLAPDVETIFFISQAKHSFITSSVVRDILRNKGSVVGLVPENLSF